MSDRVTNIEIEDVLSSIRRLVMEGGNTAPAVFDPKPLSAEPSKTLTTDADPVSSKFVLTPALRVAEPAPVAPAPVPPESQGMWPADDPLPLDIAADAVLPGAEFVPEGASDVAESDFVDAEPLAAEPKFAVIDFNTLDRRLRLADMAAGLEAAVTAQPDDWEPDGSEEVPVMDWSQTTADDAPVFRSRHAAPLRLDQRINPPPASVANDNPPFHHATASSVADDAFDDGDDPDGVARFEAIDEEPIDDDLAAFIGGGTVIDEETLRKLVIEIVRQELQGTLGERITRNVRKLVRREIARAMDSAEFE